MGDILKFVEKTEKGNYLFVAQDGSKVIVKLSKQPEQPNLEQILDSLIKGNIYEIRGHKFPPSKEKNYTVIYATLVTDYATVKTQTTEQLKQAKTTTTAVDKQETTTQQTQTTAQTHTQIDIAEAKIKEYIEKTKIDTDKLVTIEGIKAENMIALNSANNATALCSEIIKPFINDPAKAVNVLEKVFPKIYGIIFKTTINNLFQYRSENVEEQQQKSSNPSPSTGSNISAFWNMQNNKNDEVEKGKQKDVNKP